MGCGDLVGTLLSSEEKEVKKKMLLKMGMREKIQIDLKNTAKRNKKPLIYGTADMTSPY